MQVSYPKEPWHLRYWAGDSVPAAVLEFEKGAAPAPSDDDEDERILLLWA